MSVLIPGKSATAGLMLLAMFSAPAVAQSPPVHECDRLAANTFDPDKVTEGVAWKDFVPDSAIKACRSALEKYPDEPRFQYQLGRALTKAESYTEALALHRKAAEKGYAAAMNYLGSRYRKGQGVGQDNTEAVKWYRRAADKGYPAAMHNLGYMYREGLGVAKDKTEAVRLVRKAAERGYIFAMTHLGFMYENGRGVGQDYAEAVKWYRKAAEKGHSAAMTNLGFMYSKGQGVAKDEKEGVKWVSKAADKGYEPAIKWLREQGLAIPPSAAGAPTTEKSATSEALEKMPDIEGLEKLR